MKRTVILIPLAISFAWGTFRYWPLTVHVKGKSEKENYSIQMPLKDKKDLEYFFRDVCFLNAWAYTLIGSKPMSIHQYRKPWAAVRYFIDHPEIKQILLHCFWPPKIREICFFFSPQQLRIKWGWEALNKYAPYFSNSRFAFYTYPSDDCETVCLAIINKENFVKTIERHLDDFRPILIDQALDPKDLLNNASLFRFLKRLDRDGLIGTVLGFGRENSCLFERYRGLERGMGGLDSPWEDFDQAHLEALNERDRSFSPWDISDLYYPPFACDPDSEETRQLKETYRREKEEIIKFYEGKDVVEATLSLLNQKITPVCEL